jgi:hypothetical protein
VNDIFVAAPKPPGKVTNREFAKFFNILRCFDEDSDRITNDGSSAMKASDLVVLFYITAVLFTLQQLTFRIQTVSESAHVALQQLTIVTVIATDSDLSR